MRMRSLHGIALLAGIVLILVTGCAGPAVPPTPTVRIHPPTALPTQAPRINFTPTAVLPAPTPEPPQPNTLHTGSLAWDLDGKWLAYTDSYGNAYLQAASGEVLPIPGIITGWPADLQTAWSPDGKTLLVYGHWGQEQPPWSGAWLVRVTDTGPQTANALIEPVQTAPQKYQSPSYLSDADWSPDGKQIAYALAAEVWLYDTATGRAEQVSHLSSTPVVSADSNDPFQGVQELAWSPDGKLLSLWLTCNCPSPWGGVGLMDSGTGQIRLLQDGGQMVAWTPDGQNITFQNSSGDWTGGMTFDFYAQDIASGKLTNLTRSNPDWDPLIGERAYHDAPYQTGGLFWSPDGRRYGYLTRTYADSEAYPAMGFILRSSPENILEEHPGSSQAWFMYPAFLTDGRLAYLEAEGREPEPPGYGLVKVRRILMENRDPIDWTGIIGAAAWSPDGSTLALAVPSGEGGLANHVKMIDLTV